MSQLQTELETVLERAESLLEECRRGLLRIDEVTDQLRILDTQARAILPEGSVPWRIYDRGRRGQTEWWTQTPSGYIDQNNTKHVAHRVLLLRTVLAELDPEFLREAAGAKTQYFFDAGEAYRSKRTVLQIMKRAISSLAIVDEYLDEEVFDYVASLEAGVAVRLVTGNRKPMFPKLLRDFVALRPNVEAKVALDCHDRFLVLDGSHLWQLGTSLNGFGKKAFMINRVDDPEERKRFLASFDRWWSDGVSP